MPRELIFLRQEYTTRRYAIIWVSIWLILIFATWFSRPLIPYQETLLSGITWEMFQSGQYLYPSLNGQFVHNVYPLIHWLEIGAWHIFGVSEFSLRVVVSFFSLGTLFLTAWAAYQLWPEYKEVRANAPLILIGSLMWTIFATANIEYVYFTFFTMLTINFLIRVWRFREDRWWFGFAVSLLLGLFTSGSTFLLVTLPILFLAKYWAEKPLKILLYGAFSVLFALSIFTLWATLSSMKLGFSLSEALGLPSLLQKLNRSMPLYVYGLNLLVIFFPWVFWGRLYRLYRETEKDSSLRFATIWFVSLVIILGVVSLTSLDALLPLYPALCLIVARIYKQGASSFRDVVYIAIIIFGVGLALILVPLNREIFDLPVWVGDISGFWGAGLILFSITFVFNAADTRIMTLALMSVAMTLAINFGVVREATDFYDLEPAGERISWYQKRGIPVAHIGSYSGHFHFVGRLRMPLEVVHTENDLLDFIIQDPSSRVIAYVDEIDESIEYDLEYWQPFRGKFLVILEAKDAARWALQKEKEL